MGREGRKKVREERRKKDKIIRYEYWVRDEFNT